MPKAKKENEFEKNYKNHSKIGGLFIPMGIFFGLGVAFAIMKIWIVAGVLLGLGIGFLGMILYIMSKMKK